MTASAFATLNISCPDRIGITASVTSFLAQHNANIVDASQYGDTEQKVFFMRVQFELGEMTLQPPEIGPAFAKIAQDFNMEWSLHFSDRPKAMAIFVSKQDHCLYDLLLRHRDSELPANIAFIISNHDALRPIADFFHVPFYYLPVSNENRPAQEAQVLELMAQHKIELVVLARYMQILSPQFLQNTSAQIINIHHSFLPAFVGGQPYHQAYKRGVKMIGATSHYVTAELDEGPIIAQDVTQVSHRDSITDLIRKGRDIERIVLARAVRNHLEDRVMTYNGRTIVFE